MKKLRVGRLGNFASISEEAADVRFSKTSRPALGFTKPPIRCFSGVYQELLRPNVKVQSIKLSNFLHLAPTLKTSTAAHSLTHCLYSVQRNNVNITFIWPIIVGGLTLVPASIDLLILLGTTENCFSTKKKETLFYLPTTKGRKVTLLTVDANLLHRIHIKLCLSV